MRLSASGTEKAQVYIINRENVDWLVNESGIPFDYDMVVIDELSSFKSHTSKRFRALRKVRPLVKRIVGLTGTPSSNGLLDLWAEIGILDMGKRLGRYVSHFRNAYFVPDKRNQQIIFSYKPKPGAEEDIYRLISDITISMKNTDYLKLPELVMNEVPAYLSDDESKHYERMKSDMVLSLKGKEIDAVNAAALSNKLLQMANEWSMMRMVELFESTIVSWMLWRILSKQQTGNPCSLRIGTSTTLNG